MVKRIISSETYGVPNLKLDDLVVDLYWASTELDTDRQIMLCPEPLVRELQQEARFANT